MSVEPRKPDSRGSHLDMLPSNNVPVNIWKSKNLSDKRNAVDERFLAPYYIAKLHNIHFSRTTTCPRVKNEPKHIHLFDLRGPQGLPA